MFRQKHFVFSSIILGLIICVSAAAAFYPGKTPIREVAGIEQSLSVTPTKTRDDKTASDAAVKKSVIRLTPTITKTPVTQGNNSTHSEPSHNSNAGTSGASHPDTIANTPSSPDIANNTQVVVSTTPSQAAEDTPTPSEVSVIHRVSNLQCSNAANSECPMSSTAPSGNGTDSSNTAILGVSGNGGNNNPPDTAGGVQATTSQAVTGTP